MTKAKLTAHLQNLGLDPKKADKLGKQPGMSEDNPLVVKSNADIAKAQPGMILKLPDGSIMRVKQPDAGTVPAAGGATPAVPAAPVTVPTAGATPPTPITAPAGSKADTEDDDD